jgi:hypothetical protein
MFIAQHRNFEVQVNPHPTWNKQRHCVVMRRDIVPHSAEPRRLPLLRRWLSALAVTPGSQRVLVRAINDHPNIVPDLLDIGLAQLMTVEPHVEDSWKMYNLGDINRAMVTAMELSFPLAGGVFVAALDRLIAVIADNRARGLYQNGPLSLRFVKASSAYLSMMHGRDTGTCEMGMINGVHGADEIFMSYERAMYAFQVRPHWGQRQELTGAPGWLQSAYPMADRWLAVHARLNHRGVFNNHFTDRMGISIHPEPAAFSETGE